MKIAITGTSGRIGRAIHFALCHEHEVVGVDRAVSSATTHLGEIDDYKFATFLHPVNGSFLNLLAVYMIRHWRNGCSTESSQSPR